MNKKYKVDKDIVAILSEMISSMKFTNSENMDFLISMIGTVNNGYTTSGGCRSILVHLQTQNYPKTRNEELLKKRRKYEYVYRYFNLLLKDTKNIKSKLIKYYKAIEA